MKKYKKGLATVWFTGAGLIFFLLLVQTLLGRYTGSVQDVWGWFLPTVMPTLSLIIGVLVMDSLGKAFNVSKPDAYLFRLAMWMSRAYLLTVLLTILLQPFSSLPPLELIKMSHLWLGPFQGLVAAALGAFFVTKGAASNVVIPELDVTMAANAGEASKQPPANAPRN